MSFSIGNLRSVKELGVFSIVSMSLFLNTTPPMLCEDSFKGHANKSISILYHNTTANSQQLKTQQANKL